MSLELAAQHLASRGRKGDTMLVHMAPQEVAGLQALARAGGGTLTLNPDTGLPEANFLKKLLPTLIGVGLTAATGGAIAPWMIGLGLGGLETARTGSLEKGLMAGLGAYGGAGLAGGLTAAGGANLAAAGGAAPANLAGTAVPPIEAFNPSNLAASAGEKILAGVQGLGTEAGRSAAMSAMGGGMGAAKYGLAALNPMMQAEAPEPYKGSGPNPYNFTFDWERPEGPSYDSREALQLRGRLRPITPMMAAGGPVEEMSDRNQMETMMANGGQMFAEGGKTEDPAQGMTGASADAFRYLMGQSAASPATLAAQKFAAPRPAPVPMAAAPATEDVTQRGMFGMLRKDRGASQTPNYGFDPVTGQMTVFQMPEPKGVSGAGNAVAVDYGVFGGYGGSDGGGASTASSTSDGGGGMRNSGEGGGAPGEGGWARGGIASMARGGPSHLGDYSDGGRLLKGPGDGVSDSIPATIANKRPARLADGEFVVPARIVSELGNGSTEAGARKLYAMMDRIQKARSKTTGKDRVAVNSRAEKLLPA